jgi:hypothetical protein
MVDAQVRWTSYAPAIVAARAPQGLSSLCSRDQAYWLMRRRLVFDVYVEEYVLWFFRRPIFLCRPLRLCSNSRLNLLLSTRAPRTSCPGMSFGSTTF